MEYNTYSSGPQQYSSTMQIFSEWLYFVYLVHVYTVKTVHSPTNGTITHVVVTCQDVHQCTKRGREGDCKVIKKDVRNTGFKILTKLALQMFYEDRNELDMFVIPQGW